MLPPPRRLSPIKKPRKATDDETRRRSLLLLKWILNALLALVLFRLVRGLFKPAPRRTVGGSTARKLDPNQAVPARWSEVRDEEAEG